MGGLFIFKMLQQLNYKEVKAELKSAKNITFLKLSLKEFEQSKIDKHELKVKGKMYDVEHIVITNDSVGVYCFADEKEDRLIAYYQNLEKKNSDKKNSKTTLFKFLSLVYLQARQVNTTPAFIMVTNQFSICNFAFKTAVITIESPPPKLS